MAIAYVGGASGLTNAVTEPSHSAGDVLIFAAFRDGSLSKPGLPTGYTEIASNTLNSSGSILAYRIGDGSAGALTSSSATGCAVVAYSGVDNTDPFGDIQVTTGVGTSGAIPALTMQVTDGSSWVGAVKQNRVGSGSGQALAAPTGFTFRVGSSDANDQTGFHDTDGGVSSYAGETVTVGGSSNGWVHYAFELIAASVGGGTETVDVSTPGALTVAGQTVSPLETVPVTNGSMSIAGQAVAVNDTIGVTNGALTITGQTVTVTVQVLETVTVTDGALTIAGQTVTVTEIGNLTVPVDAGALTITGQEVVVSEVAPPTIRNRAIGGGTGPSDPRFIKAEEARRAKERDLWRRIDDDLHGRQRAEPEAAPAPPQRETKPLPPASEQIHEILPDAIDLLVEAMNRDTVSTLMLRHDLPYYDPEEDAAVLLLLS